jgi:hypothetical protein
MSYFEQSAWNNVRLQKQHERDLLEKKIEQRKHSFEGEPHERSVSEYGMQKAVLVEKLRGMFDRILPNLPDNEYIIMIDKYNLVDEPYPLDKQLVEELVKYLQTYKKYMSASMVDPKKLMDESHDYQSIIQRETAVPASVPDMLIPQSIPVTVEPTVQFASTPLSILQQPIIMSTSITTTPTTPITPVIPVTPALPATPAIAVVAPTHEQPVEPSVPSASTEQTDQVAEIGSPTSFTINYIEEKSIDVDVTRPIYFTSFLCTDSLVRRYKLHTMPYVLLVINSKYKIPLYLNRNPNGYYEFHKRKGPFYASRVSIQLFNHVNEPILFKNTPMELCHIQFETRID